MHKELNLNWFIGGYVVFLCKFLYLPLWGGLVLDKYHDL